MSKALEDLIDVLRPTQTDENTYQGRTANSTYGGHFLGQATAVALATVNDNRFIHSFHAYFLRGLRPGEAIEYVVDRVRDGRRFCTRRVTAIQSGKSAFEMIASFTFDEIGETIQPSGPADFDELPLPESLPTFHELMSAQDPLPFSADWALREHGVDVRVVNAPWSPEGPSVDDGIRMWIRADGNVPDDSGLHSAMLAYQSDESIADNVLVPFGLTWSSPEMFFVSLDHAMWFHRPIDMNQWHFVEQQPVTAGHGRGVASGYVWSQDRQLIASFTQEALMRKA